MQGQNETNQLDYAELMKRYNELKTQMRSAQQKKVKIKSMDQEIENINNLIKSTHSYESNLPKQEDHADEQRIAELQKLIEEEQNSRKRIEIIHNLEIIKLEKQLNDKKNMLNANLSIVVDQKLTEKALDQNKDIQTISNHISILQKEILQLEHSNKVLQQEFALLQKQMAQKQVEHSKAEETSKMNQQIQKEKSAAIASLENQLKQLNQDFEIIKKTIQQEQFKLSSKSQQNRKNQENYGRQQADLEQLRDKLKKEIQIKEKQRGLERDKLIVQNNKLIQQKEVIADLEKENNLLDKHSSELDKRITQLRKKLKELKEQEKPARKQKGEKNYKHQIFEAEKEIQQLEKQLQRQKKRLNQILKVKSGYVSQDLMHNLQQEYTKLKQNVKPFDTESRKNVKLLQENKLLKQRIQYLKKADQNAIKQKKATISQVRAKIQHLNQQRQLYQKTIGNNQQKLSLYMKQFPNHEKQKQMQKNLKKHHKHSSQVSTGQSNIQNQSQGQNGAQNHGKKKRDRRRSKIVQQTEEQFAIDESLLPQSRKQPQIYMNRNVQIVALGVVIILGLILSSMLN